MRQQAIANKTKDSVINLVLDAIGKNKQAIVFVGTKKSAEKMAEDISRHLPLQENCGPLVDGVLTALSKPTKQCERLAAIIKHACAFHHAGLSPKQKDIIEEGFRKRMVKVIACTPTLAYGLDLPAFRVVIRDVKRYGTHGMGFIPVLDYLQMAGRAGRPTYDKFGEAVLVADTEAEAMDLLERYVHGEPEDIISKLAVEPVLRTYVLSLIATRVTRTRGDIMAFFSETFWAYQYKDMGRLRGILDEMIDLLQGWQFIEGPEAGEADGDVFTPTLVGERVAQLYLDPLTAHDIIKGINRASERGKVQPFPILALLCNRLEMRPILRVGVKEWELYEQIADKETQYLLEIPPNLYDPYYDEFIGAIKTAKMLDDWMDERTEDYLLETFNATPGELHTKLRSADWLLYACTELAKLLGKHEVIKHFLRVRIRLEYGAREELLPLLRIEGVGRIRARMLFNAGFKDVGDVRSADFATLAQLLGKGVAEKVKKSLGEPVPEAVKPTKRKGQMGLGKYDTE
jgi:helicase